MLPCLLLLMPLSATAQGPVDGAIRGRVFAAGGAPVGHAHLVLQAIDTAIDTASDTASDTAGRPTDAGVAKQFDAAADGSFLLLRLVPGDYRLSVLGSASVSSTNIVVVAGGIADVSLTPQVRPASASSNPTSNTTSNATSSSQLLLSLPLPAQPWESVAALDSTANDAGPAARLDASAASNNDSDDSGDSNAVPSTQSPADSGSAADSLSYAGLAPTQNSELLDGLTLQPGFRAVPRGASIAAAQPGGARTAASFGEGTVRSLRRMPRNWSAQYGGGVGAEFAVVSRSGAERRGNGLHGSALWLLRSSALAAANPFSIATHYRDGIVTAAAVKPSGQLQHFGAALGLPLPLHRPTAIFASVEAQRRSDQIVSTPSIASFFTLTPTQTALLRTRGVSTAATNAALNYLDGLTGTASRSATRLTSFARADGEITPRDALTLAYIGNYLSAPRGVAQGQVSDAVVSRGLGSLGDSSVQANAATARWLHTFSPRWNNELRTQLAHDLEYETPHAPLPQEPAIGPGGLAPQVSIAGQFAYGTPSSLGRTAYPEEQRVQLADAMQLHLGRHLLTLGADWSRLHDRIASETNTEGSFTYDSSTISGHAGGLVDWITDATFNVNAYPNGGCPNINAAVHYFCFRSFSQSFGGQQTVFATHEFAAFAEDALRPRADLTLTLGLRWDYTLLPLPQVANPALDADIAALAAPIGGSTARFPEDRNNFGPRLAAAYSPRWLQSTRGRTTVELGYGGFFGRIPGVTVRSALVDTALPSTALHIRILPTTITACPQITGVSQGFGYPCAYTGTPPAAVQQTTSATVFARNLRTPAIQRASLALQHESHALLLRATYAMVQALQLPSSTDLNIAPSTALKTFVLQGGTGRPGVRDGGSFSVPLYTARPIPQYGPITAVESNANATWHAATLEARFATHRLQLRASYTFSRAIDYAARNGVTPLLNGQFDPFSNGYDKGLSSLQYPQRFAGDLIYVEHLPANLPPGLRLLHSGPLHSALDGWRIAAIATAGSGAPYSYQIFGGTRLPGGHESINGSGGATYLPTVGRNTLRLPAQARLDLRLGRDLNTGAHTRLSLYAEAFNLLNTRNLAGVETRAFLVGTTANGITPLVFQNAATIAAEGLNTPPFGAATSSTTGLSRERQVELGIRLTF